MAIRKSKRQGCIGLLSLYRFSRAGTGLLTCTVAAVLAGCGASRSNDNFSAESAQVQQVQSSISSFAVAPEQLSSASSSSVLNSTETPSSTRSSQLSVPGFDYSKLQKTQPTSAKLALAEADVFEQHIKNGLRLYLSSQYRMSRDCWYPEDWGSSFSASSCDYVFDNSQSSFAVVSSQAASSSQAAAPVTDGVATSSVGNAEGFSETNTHVSGVDEIDFAKYDGDYWYIATVRTPEASPLLRVYDADAKAATLTLAGSLPIEVNATQGFYLLQTQGQTDAVAFLHSDNGYYDSLPGEGYWGGAHYANGSMSIDLADVTEPQNPQMAWQIAIDGSVIESRKVGNTLYIVSRYEPWLDGAEFDYQDDDVRAQNEAAIEAASLEDLLPKVRIEQTETVLAPRCYLQASVSENDGYRSLVYVTTIDLAERKVADSICVNSAVDGLSMTRESLYLTGTWYDNGAQTTIHKFNVDNTDLAYAATGTVEGSIQGRSDAAFRLHDHEGDLRIVTSKGRVHQLFILEQFGEALELVSKLPNSARPEAIGKPGEDIYAVRFEGEAAYIVTFRQTDPLYKIDLSDRFDPKIAGELEVTGFSTYLHPLERGYAFGLGKEANEFGRVTGMKVALYDVSGDEPVELQSHVYDGWDADSVALNDLHAVTVSADKTRFVIPVAKGRSNREGRRAGFLLFELDRGEEVTLNAVGAFVTYRFGDDNSYATHRARSVLHNDAVFMTQGGEVWADTWQALTSAAGKADHQFFRCEAVGSSILNISVSTENTYACNANIDFVNDRTGESFDIPGSAEDHGFCRYQVPINTGGEFTVSAILEGFESQRYSLSVPEYFCANDLQPIDIVF